MAQNTPCLHIHPSNLQADVALESEMVALEQEPQHAPGDVSGRRGGQQNNSRTMREGSAPLAGGAKSGSASGDSRIGQALGARWGNRKPPSAARATFTP
eukprot:3780830-Alexandrium_andersonii.AAC.1